MMLSLSERGGGDVTSSSADDGDSGRGEDEAPPSGPVRRLSMLTIVENVQTCSIVECKLVKWKS